MCDDYEEDPYDYCYECSGYGDDYYMDEDGELVCRCPECHMNPNYDQVIAKLAVLVRNLEPKQGRIREEHDLWNEKWIIAHVRRTLISYGLYESGKS